MKRLVIGILAHVDAGKTTLSEAMLYACGEIKKAGRVDHGNAFLDSHALERDRGITIFSKQALLHRPQALVTLLDTPGHVDFSTEMERTLGVLDYAILVISGTDGVQSHTETLWHLLARRHIPTFLFINKMDLPGPGRSQLLQQLKHRLGEGCTDFSVDTPLHARQEALALCEESLMQEYLETGEIASGTLVRAIAQRHVFPCYFGAARVPQGVEALLEGLDTYTCAPTATEEFGARIFKIARDTQGNRLTYLKITGGSLAVKTLLQGTNPAWAEKVNEIRLYSGEKYQTVDTALPGTVCAVTGLTHTRPGQGLGVQPAEETPVLEPVLRYRVELPPTVDAHTALARLRLLEEEDPQLHVMWSETLAEIHVQLMGEVQLEILQRILSQRFAMDVTFTQGSIVYKETIAHTVEGVGHFEPLRHYAEVHLLLEPGPRGSGLQVASACSEDALDKNWQRLILSHLQEKAHRGVLTGAPVTDLRITLAAGRAHLKHTEGGDFREATYRAVRQGLRQTESILLEPWYEFRLEVPAESIGRAMADLQRRNGTFGPPETSGDTSVLQGSVPVACLRGYQIELAGYTRGKGRLFCTLKGYEPCHNTQEVIAAAAYDCDSDVENTADSVFCAHGAGFTVPWNEVPHHMHLESVLKKPAPPSQTRAETTRRAVAYCATLEQDKELLQIFERTYGPIRRDLRAAFAPVPAAADEAPPRDKYAGTEYLLVDGYNIIHAWDDLKAMAEHNLDGAREQLIHILCNYQGFRQCQVIVVFDAYKVRGNPGEVVQAHNIHVVYTKEAETADMYIEKVTHQLGRSHKVRVATSDRMEQLIIAGHGALRVSAQSFREEVARVEQAIREFLQP